MWRLFSGLMRLKHLGVRIITCGFIEGRLNLTYNNSANVPPSMMSYFYRKATFVRVLCPRAVQRVLSTKNFTLIISRRLYNAEDINKKKG